MHAICQIVDDHDARNPSTDPAMPSPVEAIVINDDPIVSGIFDCFEAQLGVFMLGLLRPDGFDRR